METRYVPVTLCLRALFGGMMNQFGWFFFGFGMLFFWAFGMRSDVLAFWKFSAPLRTVNGTVVRSVETGASEGGDDSSSGTPIYRIEYTFTPAGSGTVYRGASYNTGWKIGKSEAVTVEYKADHPAYSRIRGMRSSEFGAGAIAVVIFPLAGLIIMGLGIRKGIRAIAMLYKGTPAVGTLVSVEPTNTELNDRTVYRMTFRFPLPNGGAGTAQLCTANLKPAWQYFRTGNQQFPAPPTAQAPSSELQEVVLYAAGNPSVSFIPAEFARHIDIDNRGNVRDRNPAIGLLASLLPILIIVGHGWYALILLSHAEGAR